LGLYFTMNSDILKGGLISDRKGAAPPRVGPDSNFALTLYGRPVNHKFCYLCGKKTRAQFQKLQKHYQGQHKGEKPKFLAFGDQPLDCMYSNWEEWLKDPSLPLLVKAELGKSWRGRPRAAPMPPNSGIRQSNDDEELVIKEADPAAQGVHGGEMPDISDVNVSNHNKDG
jgi:hypothetical protein